MAIVREITDLHPLARVASGLFTFPGELFNLLLVLEAFLLLFKDLPIELEHNISLDEPFLLDNRNFFF